MSNEKPRAARMGVSVQEIDGRKYPGVWRIYISEETIADDGRSAGWGLDGFTIHEENIQALIDLLCRRSSDEPLTINVHMPIKDR